MRGNWIVGFTRGIGFAIALSVPTTNYNWLAFIMLVVTMFISDVIEERLT